MDLTGLYRELIAAARANAPSDRVPYAFEKRILARLQAQPRLDDWALWARALWRAAAACVAIMLLLGAWSLLGPAAPPPSSDAPAGDLSQQLENTLLAAVDQDQTADSTW
jgi:hypothetical protein